MNLRKSFFTAALCTLALVANAQQSRMEMAKDNNLSASNYTAYPGPKAKLTPAPKGYEPFYLSHYGRHGSRYLIGTKDYDQPYNILLKAEKQGKLTPLGVKTLERVKLIRDEASHRDGELTLRGAEQHKGIARRMMQRFPQIFADSAHVDARSTIVIRCILSMENALQQLLTMNPKLKVSHDASMHDMYYMNQDDPQLEQLKRDSSAMAVLKAFSAKHEHFEGLMNRLFNDKAYWHDSVDVRRLNDALYKLASNVQSTELRHRLSLYDIFTKDELYDNWLRTNAWWYITYGPSPLNGGTQPYSQRNLLRNIIQTADSCIALPHPGATLRYGHDTMVMPLTCLLDLNGYGKQIQDLEQLDDQNWCDYKIFPMACNLQWVFYRPTGKDAGHKPILFKILQNEDEAHLPIATNNWPYYRWDDFKTYYLKKLEAYGK